MVRIKKYLDPDLTMDHEYLTNLAQKSLLELTNEVIPFWERSGFDTKHGGFICGLSHKGAVVDSSKFSWYQGRGAWIFSKMYERTKNKKHLDIAKGALAFVEKHCRNQQKDGNNTFLDVVSRDGTILEGRSQIDQVGYASLFHAEGLQQVAVHEQDMEKKKKMLSDVMLLCQNFLSNCNKNRNAPEPAYLLSKPYQLGTRTLGHQMIPLRLATQVLSNHAAVVGESNTPLEKNQREYFEQVAKDMVENITVHFYDNDVGLTREELSHSFEPLHDPSLYYLGHAIEAYWFVLEEAERLKDVNMMEMACDRILRHVECAWDPVYGGLNRGLTLQTGAAGGKDEYNDKTLMDKVGWVQQEGLVALMMVRERSGREKTRKLAASWFERLHAWVEEKFPLKRHGYELWLVGGDRSATFKENYTFGDAGLKSRKENYHHPRYLMMVLEESERSNAKKKKEEEEEEEEKKGGGGGGDNSSGGGTGMLSMLLLFVLSLSVLYDLLFKSPLGDDGVDGSGGGGDRDVEL